LNNTKGVQANKTGATITLTRDSLNAIALGETTLDAANADGSVKVTGDNAKQVLVSMLNNLEFWFNIVTL
jgi:alkyl sulfatase BDS1-like metallo-beta-lactamase superfamily hydrolase